MRESGGMEVVPQTGYNNCMNLAIDSFKNCENSKGPNQFSIVLKYGSVIWWNMTADGKRDRLNRVEQAENPEQ